MKSCPRHLNRKQLQFSMSFLIKKVSGMLAKLLELIFLCLFRILLRISLFWCTFFKATCEIRYLLANLRKLYVI